MSAPAPALRARKSSRSIPRVGDRATTVDGLTGDVTAVTRIGDVTHVCIVWDDDDDACWFTTTMLYVLGTRITGPARHRIVLDGDIGFDQETAEPVVYLDAYRGWVREVPRTWVNGWFRVESVLTGEVY